MLLLPSPHNLINIFLCYTDLDRIYRPFLELLLKCFHVAPSLNLPYRLLQDLLFLVLLIIIFRMINPGTHIRSKSSLAPDSRPFPQIYKEIDCVLPLIPLSTSLIFWFSLKSQNPLAGKIASFKKYIGRWYLKRGIIFLYYLHASKCCIFKALER